MATRSKSKTPKRDLEAEIDELKAEVEWLKRLIQEVRTMKRGRE